MLQKCLVIEIIMTEFIWNTFEYAVKNGKT